LKMGRSCTKGRMDGGGPAEVINRRGRRRAVKKSSEPRENPSREYQRTANLRRRKRNKEKRSDRSPAR